MKPRAAVLCLALLTIPGCGPLRPPPRSAETIFGDQRKFRQLNHKRICELDGLTLIDFFSFEAISVEALNATIVKEKFFIEEHAGAPSDNYGAGDVKTPSWWNPSTLSNKRSSYRLHVMMFANSDDLDSGIFLQASSLSRRFFIVQYSY